MSSIRYFESLPVKLQKFFARYPPSVKYAEKPVSTYDINANPFLPNKHPVTQKYHDPKISRRNMSDIYKLASLHGVESFLPPINKLFYEEKYNNKTFMKGVLFPKGHKHELTMDAKLLKMKEGIKNADKLILESKGSKYARRLEKKKSNTKNWI